MKQNVKAALMSALVFPGAGHFILGRAARGCLFIAPCLLAAIYVGAYVIQRANQVMALVESGALPLDPQLIAERISAAPGDEGPMMTVAVVVCLLCWAGSIADALWIGAAHKR